MTDKMAVGKEEVLATERRWVEAHRNINLQDLEAIMANDYVQIQSDGSLKGKKEVLESYKNGKRYWSFADSDENDVRISDNMATLIGRWHGIGVNDGTPFDYKARFLSVYVLRNGSWKLMAEQSTDILE